MSSDKILPTSIERLPIEILVEIFALLPLEELVTAFSGLTSYIDSIIRSTRGTSHLVRDNNVHAIQCLNLFPTQITRLAIIHAVDVNLTALINLRALTLKYGTHAQFDSIRPQFFPTLEILYIHASEY
jgi:hypothetical protein